MRNSVSHGNEQTRISTSHWTDSDPSHADEVNKKTRIEQKQVLVILTAHGFIYDVGSISTGGIRSFQWPSWDICISWPLITTIPIGCFPTQASVEQYRTASRELHVNSSQLHINWAAETEAEGWLSVLLLQFDQNTLSAGQVWKRLASVGSALVVGIFGLRACDHVWRVTRRSYGLSEWLATFTVQFTNIFGVLLRKTFPGGSLSHSWHCRWV